MLNIATGDIATYREEGCLGRVKVLEVKRDEKGIGYTVELLDLICPSRFGPKIGPQVGQVFDLWHAHGYAGYAGWHLSREEAVDGQA